MNGIWLPERGVWEGRRIALDDDGRKKLAQALQARQLSREADFKDSRTQARFLEAVREAFGKDEPPTALLAPPIRIEMTYKRVNEGGDECVFDMQVPVEYAGTDEFTRREKPAGSRVWTAPPPSGRTGGTKERQ